MLVVRNLYDYEQKWWLIVWRFTLCMSVSRNNCFQLTAKRLTASVLSCTAELWNCFKRLTQYGSNKLEHTWYFFSHSKAKPNPVVSDGRPFFPRLVRHGAFVWSLVWPRAFCCDWSGLICFVGKRLKPTKNDHARSLPFQNTTSPKQSRVFKV